MRSRLVVVVVVVVIVAACEPAPPPDGQPGRALISLFDVDDDLAVCSAGAPGFRGLASRNCALEVGADTEQTFIIENSGDTELVVDRVTFVDGGAPGFHLVSAPVSVAVGALEDVVVGNDGGFVGSDVLRIESDAANDPVVEIALVSGEEGEGETDCFGDIEVVPAACDFGNVVIGDTGFCDVSISDNGACELIVKDFAFSPETPNPLVFGIDGNFSVPTTVPGGAGVSVRLYARPQDGLTSRGALLIESFDPDEPTVSVPLRVNGI